MVRDGNRAMQVEQRLVRQYAAGNIDDVAFLIGILFGLGIE
jgi:hypothetical protein